MTVTSDQLSKADLRASAAAAVAVSPAAANSVSYTTTEDWDRELDTREGTSWLKGFLFRSMGYKRGVCQLPSVGQINLAPMA